MRRLLTSWDSLLSLMGTSGFLFNNDSDIYIYHYVSQYILLYTHHNIYHYISISTYTIYMTERERENEERRALVFIIIAYLNKFL